MENLPSILAAILKAEARPLHLNRLVRRAIAEGWRLPPDGNYFRPGCRYARGSHFAYRGIPYAVLTVTEAGNPRQGPFQVLTVRSEHDGEERRLAAAVRTEQAAGVQRVTLAEMETLYQTEPAKLRRYVAEAVTADPRFALLQREEGQLCALRALLPVVDDVTLTRVRLVLQAGAAGDGLRPVSTDELLLHWPESSGLHDDDVSAFALELALQELDDVIYISGAGWAARSAWMMLGARPALLGPRLPNVLPAFAGAAELAEEAESAGAEPPTALPQEAAAVADAEAWRAQRRLESRFTLRPTHYYRHYLPLTRTLRRIFPPWPCRVTIHYDFAGRQGNFVAFVDPQSERVLADSDMGAALAANGVYPGAILALSHRGTDFDYDLRTLPLVEARPVTVRRLFRDEDGELEMVDDEELLTYEVDGAAFVAGARWEDVEALFLQGERVGKGIFSLVYLACWERLLNSGRDVIITARELFQAIHFDDGGRLTSQATVSRELSRRLAFESLGDGRFRFRPQHGAALVNSAAAKPETVAPELAAAIAGANRQAGREANIPLDAWSVLSRDKHKREVLEQMAAQYMADTAREKVLFIRDLAHRRIRRLLCEQALPELTLTTFNKQIWRMGALTIGDRRLTLDSEETISFLRRIDLPAIEQAVAAGDLRASGNQSWGSGSAVFGPSLALPLPEKTELVTKTLRELLYGSEPDGARIRRALRFGNGFGINSVSGILHVMFPETYVVYNRRAADVLQALDFTLPGDWDRNVELYLSYCAFCRDLRDTFGFLSLADVDWFIYRWGSWGSAIGGLLTTDGAQDLQLHVPRQLSLFESGKSPENENAESLNRATRL